MKKYNIDASYVSENEFMISGRIYRIHKNILFGNNWKHSFEDAGGVIHILLYERVLNISLGKMNGIIRDYCLEMI